MASRTWSAQRGVKEEVPLEGRLAEFRAALRDEIEAARRAAASGAVPLMEGRRFAASAGAFQYRFRIESVLSLPDGSPGDLIVPGRRPLEASVLAVEGLTVSVSVSEDLGEFVPRATLQSSLVHLLRKLISRIEDVAGRENAAGGRLLGDQPPAGKPRLPAVGQGALEHLNAEQADAVASALGRDTTFIWGPPGTGKTRTIGTIGELLYRERRSVLVVSHTNAAVDQALLHVADALRVEDGSVLRLGAPRDRRLAERKELLAETHIERQAKELAAERDQLEQRRAELQQELHEIERLLALADWLAEAVDDIAGWHGELERVRRLEASLEEARQRCAALAGEESARAAKRAAAAAMAARVRVLPQLEERERRAELLLSRDEAGLRGAQLSLRESEELLRRANEASGLTRRWRGLPKPEEQETVVTTLASEAEAAGQRRDAAEADVDQVRAELVELREALAAFVNDHGADPQDLLSAVEGFFAELSAARNAEEQQRGLANEARSALEQRLRQPVGAVKAWRLVSGSAFTAEEMLELLAEAVTEAKRQLVDQELASLRSHKTELEREVSTINARLAAIEEALQQVEETVVGEARVVATTLTRAYLRDSIQNRRFDTVILDEASMAPIPALWMAAAVAQANVVLVGDFKQLPPICHAEEGPAAYWLGRDVFDVAGVRAAWEHGQPPPHFVALRRQYRMHPAISSVVNDLIYAGHLRDEASAEDDRGLDAWYRRDWGYDSPLLLVDTGSTHAWVTSVASAGRASRLNFLSATVCVDIAERLLAEGREELPPGERPRILICAPYRPHARLLSLLIKDQGLDREVVAGTAHTFQGNEADVVIFDLVNDEPHWKVGMFMPDFDETNKQLLNVALTRARRRLIVVGDFAYVVRNAKRAFLGRLIRRLEAAAKTVEAVEIVPEGLAARAAQAQLTTTGGAVEAPAERIVVTQQDFFSYLSSDLAAAHQRVIIYSPFITSNRLGKLEVQLKATIERGVAVYVVTKTLGERSQSDEARNRTVEAALQRWGVVVIHKFHMHEKLVFIDDQIVWSGSLNPLSFSNTQEIMERRSNTEVARDYARTVRMAEMIDLYARGEARCPICEHELGPAEGRDEPFYWRCVDHDDCSYSRSISQPAPTNGLILCASCGGAVKFGEWGGKTVWRCVENPRHRQPVAKTHLRLPKMRALVPKHELRKLEKQWGLTPARARRPKEEVPEPSHAGAQLDFHFKPGEHWA